MGLLSNYIQQMPQDDLAYLASGPGASFDSGGMTYSGTWLTPGGEDTGNRSRLQSITGVPSLGGPKNEFGMSMEGSYPGGTPYEMYDGSGAAYGEGATLDGGAMDGGMMLALALISGGAMAGMAGLGGGMGGGFGGDIGVGMGDLGGDAFAGDSFMGGMGGMSEAGIPGMADLGGDAFAGDAMGGLGAGGAGGIEQMFRDASMSGAGGGAGGLSSILSHLGQGGFGSLAQLIGGGLGLGAGNKGSNLINDLIKRSDPFSDYRKGYADKLQGMFDDPAGSVTKMPGFEAGQEAIQRSMAANGYIGSGNMAASMQKYGGEQWMQQAQFLSQLAGAQFQPGANAVGLGNLAGQAQATTNNSWMNVLKGLGGLAPTIMSSFGNGGSGGGEMADYAASALQF